MLFPLLQAVREQWKRYPMWFDNLYLSIFAQTQEYDGDVFLHTHNIRGVADTVNDELFALFGVIIYVLIFTRSMYLRRRRAPRQHARR